MGVLVNWSVEEITESLTDISFCTTHLFKWRFQTLNDQNGKSQEGGFTFDAGSRKNRGKSKKTSHRGMNPSQVQQSLNRRSAHHGHRQTNGSPLFTATANHAAALKR